MIIEFVYIQSGTHHRSCGEVPVWRLSMIIVFVSIQSGIRH